MVVHLFLRLPLSFVQVIEFLVKRGLRTLLQGALELA